MYSRQCLGRTIYHYTATGTFVGSAGKVLINSTAFTIVFIPTNPDLALVTTGLIILGPTLSNDSNKRYGVICSVNARWDRAQHTLTDQQSSTLKKENHGDPVSAPVSGQGSVDGIQNGAAPVDDGNWRSISADSDWLEALGFATPNNFAPGPPTNSSSLTTALGNIYNANSLNLTIDLLTGSDTNDLITSYESITSAVFADAISRIGLGKIHRHASQILYTNTGPPCTPVDNPLYNFCPLPTTGGQYTPMTYQGHLTGKATLSSELNLGRIAEIINAILSEL